MSEVNGEKIILRCVCCGLPFATVHNGVIMVQSRHHGEMHTNVIAVSELIKLVEVQKEESGINR